jgi:hypothetical protein
MVESLKGTVAQIEEIYGAVYNTKLSLGVELEV